MSTRNIIIDNIFTENSVSQLGGAIHIQSGYGITINNNTFHNNYATLGAAISLTSENFHATTSFNKFTNNTAGIAGGAIYNNGLDNIIKNCQFIDNYSRNSGGAIHNGIASNVNIERCTFFGNGATYVGGAIYSETGNIINIKSSNFDNNYAVFGGAIMALDVYPLTIIDGKISNNKAQNGSAIYLQTFRWPNNLFDLTNVNFLNQGTTPIYYQGNCTITCIGTCPA